MDKTVSMSLVDLNGNRLQQASMDVPATREIEVNLSGYPVGVYVIQLEGKTVKTSIKVIKK
jgi:ribosomal 50S subunit-recycling heat shock protein